MAVINTGVRRDLGAARKLSNNRQGFVTKAILEEEAFFEGLWSVRTKSGQRHKDYGYSKNNIPLRRFRDMIEASRLNAIAKAALREGFVFQESDDVLQINHNEIADIELLDYNFYYTAFTKQNDNAFAVLGVRDTSNNDENRVRNAVTEWKFNDERNN